MNKEESKIYVSLCIEGMEESDAVRMIKFFQDINLSLDVFLSLGIE